MPNAIFAWCFDHGLLHTFSTDAEPWCTAHWVGFATATEEEALAAKVEAYGDAIFFDQLTPDQQLNVMGVDA